MGVGAGDVGVQDVVDADLRSPSLDAAGVVNGTASLSNIDCSIFLHHSSCGYKPNLVQVQLLILQSVSVACCCTWFSFVRSLLPVYIQSVVAFAVSTLLPSGIGVQLICNRCSVVEVRVFHSSDHCRGLVLDEGNAVEFLQMGNQGKFVSPGDMAGPVLTTIRHGDVSEADGRRVRVRETSPGLRGEDEVASFQR